MIEVVATQALNTVQDLGRFGARHYGVSTSGVMDPVAFRVANQLVGNPDSAAVIEIQTFPFVVRFLADIAFAVTGADAPISLDGRKLPSWWSDTARSGQVLSLSMPRSGSRAYLALASGFDVPVILNSRSTHLRSCFGGFEGRSLQAGDVLRTLPSDSTAKKPVGVMPAQLAISLPDADLDETAMIVRVIRAGEYGIFPPAMQARFWETRWKISHQSDRAGYRLSGPPLELPAPIELRSYGLLAGIVQVPPSGIPIIQLSDANTAGGYPKIATVIEADLWRLGQARPGSLIRFVDVSHEEATAAMSPIEAYLANVRRSIDLFRTM